MNIATIFRSALTIISPKLNTNVVYFVKKKRLMNWIHPNSFSEKLLKLRIEKYNSDPLVKKCADKYLVRDYINNCGFGYILNDLLAVYDCVEDIKWDKLPIQFAMKLNYACGYNIICDDKEQLDKDYAISKLEKWINEKPWLWYAELQYRGVDKKILVERYIRGKDGESPADYKLYCFNGEPLAILYITGRFSENIRAGFFDLDWNYLGRAQNHYFGFDDIMPPKPASIGTMIEASKVLSVPFPFVRIDFYDVDGKAVFGEMTFSPSGGFDASEINIGGKTMGDLLKI